MRRALTVLAAVIGTLGALAEVLSFTMANGSFFVQRAHDIYKWMAPAHLAERPLDPRGTKPETCAQDNLFVHRICKDKHDGKLGPRS